MFRFTCKLWSGAMMNAIVQTEFGESSVLQYTQVPIPELRNDKELLIKVCAAGVNRADIAQRRGHHHKPDGASDYLGLEVSGIVEKVGPGVTKYKEGDKVMALLEGGGYAEYVAAPEGTTLPIPHGYSFVEAAAIPESFITAWMLLKFKANVQAGQRVLIHAGPSCLGLAASQIVEKIIRGKAITTSSEHRIEQCKRFASINVSRTLDDSGSHFAAKIKAILGEEGVHVIIDPVLGSAYMEENASLLADKGTILIVSYVGGARIQFNALPLYRQRARMLFCQLRGQPLELKEAVASSFEKEVLPHINERMIVPTLYKSFPLSEAAQAQNILESGQANGKIVLTVGNTKPHLNFQ